MHIHQLKKARRTYLVEVVKGLVQVGRETEDRSACCAHVISYMRHLCACNRMCVYI